MHGKGACMAEGDMCGRGGGMYGGGYAWQRGVCAGGIALQGVCVALGYAWQERATAADDTRPTGMHFCYSSFLL